MSTRLRHASSIPGKVLRAAGNALLVMLALGTAAALHAQQSADKSRAGTYSLLHSFQCSPDGETPESGLIQDSSGNLYGTTINGGQHDYGTVFKVSFSGVVSVLHSFAGPPTDGRNPIYGSLTLDAAGNVYGTTYSGGEFGYGTVFEVGATGTESILYNFCPQSGCPDGANPFGGIARDSAGDLYGTTYYGGVYRAGVVFKLTTSGTESVLHSFGSSSADGAYPSSNLIRDPSGNLYGTTDGGGTSSAGTVFEVDVSGAENVVYSFNGIDGGGLYGGGLLRDTSGNLYGVTEYGGANGAGVVFKLIPGDAQSVLLNFTGTDGEYPIDGLARDAAGNLYGTAPEGGSGANCGFGGCGVLFGLTTAAKEIVLHDFNNSSSDGTNPVGGVVRDSSGNLYGTLSGGGAYGCGAVFKFTP
jgi:uncharacterized repeat protein (TIGR03803 family)